MTVLFHLDSDCSTLSEIEFIDYLWNMGSNWYGAVRASTARALE